MANAPALTHHEILTLVEPFTRRGRHVDLAASDRAGRKLAFKAAEIPAVADGVGTLHEVLTMDCRYTNRFVLQRTLRHASGAEATLEAVGKEPGALLAAIEAIAPAQHFRAGSGYLIARSYGFWTREDEAIDPVPSTLFLERAVAHVDGMTLTLTQSMPRFRSVAADLVLKPTAGARFNLPEDLLAVIGWDWARLVVRDDGWTSKLRLRGNALRRSRTAEREIERAASYLVAKFAEPPALFHDRHVLARWGVVFRRGIPTITAVTMIGAALALTASSEHQESAGIFMALHYVPIAILALAFSLQELPQFEIPPLPRRSKLPAWREDGVEGMAGDAVV